jgi:hypothetical protein
MKYNSRFALHISCPHKEALVLDYDHPSEVSMRLFGLWCHGILGLGPIFGMLQSGTRFGSSEWLTGSMTHFPTFCVCLERLEELGMLSLAGS